jgi:hypothetical protein
MKIISQHLADVTFILHSGSDVVPILLIEQDVASRTLGGVFADLDTVA